MAIKQPEDILQEKTKIGYFHILLIFYTLILIISNTAAIKVGLFFGNYLDVGTVFFPIAYILNDVITEVYGFRTSRIVIWASLGFNLIFTAFMFIAVMIPGAPNIESTMPFNTIFALSPRLLLASATSFLIGEFANSLVLALMKIKYNGKYFGFRAITSTLIGVTIESCIFAFIAFYGRIGFDDLIQMSLLLIVVKVLYEFLSLPITTRLVKFLKQKEGIDFYDYNTKFSILPI